MKIIINRCFGGFCINEVSLKELGIKETVNMRVNPELIKAIESGKYVNSCFSKLTIVTIPDEATDFAIEEYDGNESIIYVLNGKLYWA